MPENSGEGKVFETIPTDDLLQELSRRLGSSQDPKNLALASAIRSYSEVAQTNPGASELNNPEDEFIQSVRAVSIFGKFPQGLNFKGNELVPPQADWTGDFGVYSPSGFHTSRRDGWNYSDFIRRCLGTIDSSRVSAQTENLMKKHFLAVIPYDDPKREEKYKDGYALLIYNALQDRSVLDSGGRHARWAEVSFLMPMDKAQQFIQLIEEKNNGADIMEQFVQKAAPGVMANKQGELGVYRVQSSELEILDTKFLNNLLTARNQELFNPSNGLMIGPRFLESVDSAIVKQYSQPVGFGTPPS